MANDLVDFRVLRSADRRGGAPGLYVDLMGGSLQEVFAFLTAEQRKALMTEAQIAALQPTFTALITVTGSPEPALAAARSWLQSIRPAFEDLEPAFIDPLLIELDAWLVANGDAPADGALDEKLKELARKADPDAADAQAFLARAKLIRAVMQLTITLLAAMLTSQDTALFPYHLRQRAMRLYLVLSLVIRRFADPASVDEQVEVQRFLRHARLRIPPLMLRGLRRADRLARRAGFIDHYVVREAWERYELGELADVNSVMPGELRRREHLLLQESEEAATDQREGVTTSQNDLQSENRYELSQAAKEAQSLYVGAEANVQNTTVTGPSTTTVNLGGQFEYSSALSKESASRHARQIVERASSTVSERVFKARSSRSLLRVKEKNLHEFNNTGAGAKPINGLYRWVDKVNRVSLYRYPQRYVLEFVLPEPGAWLAWALANRGPDTRRPTAPVWPTYLNSADDILSAPGVVGDYLLVAKLLGATDVPVMPQKRILGATLSRENEEGVWQENAPGSDPSDKGRASDICISTEARIAIPEGWRAVKFKVTANTRTNVAGGGSFSSLWISVGDGRCGFTGSLGSKVFEGVLGGMTTGQLPIYGMGRNVFGFVANIVVECEPTDEAMAAWRQAVFDRFLQTYQRARAAYDAQIEAMKMAGELDERTLSAGRVQTLIQAELKRQVITLLEPDIFSGPAVVTSPPGAEPVVDPVALSARAAQVLFFEQAFEWSTLSWILYPYYWARKAQWVAGAVNETPDPEFDAFTAAGSARVVVAARPGYEEQIQLYLDYGVLWGGFGPPAPADPNYISVAEEIRDLQQGPSDGELTDSWTVRLPTALTALDEQGVLPLVRPAS